MTNLMILRRAAELFEVPEHVVLTIPYYAVADKLRDSGEDAMADEVQKISKYHPSMQNFKPWINSALEPLIGRTILEMRADDDSIYFRLEDGEYYSALVDGDCCSTSWMYRVLNASTCYGGKVLTIVENDPDDVDDNDGLCRQESESIYGIGILTDKGIISIVYRNSSNGYYGGWMETLVKSGSRWTNAEILPDVWINGEKK